jgi:hypothetical protein
MSDHLLLDNASMSDVVSALQGLASRAQARLDHLTSLHAQLLSTSQGQYTAAADDIINQAKAYFGHVVNTMNGLATQVPAAISHINTGDSQAASLFGGSLA